MKFKFDFVTEVWLQNLEIEAANQEEAMQKLISMSISDMLEQDEYYVKDTSIKQNSIDYVCVEQNVKYEVSEYTTEEYNVVEDADIKKVIKPTEKMVVSVEIDPRLDEDELKKIIYEEISTEIYKTKREYVDVVDAKYKLISIS